MKVHLKQRQTKKGRLNYYLEIYRGYTKTSEGKIKHHRDSEKLSFFQYVNPKTVIEKQHNKDHKACAEAVQAKRILEIQNGVYGLANKHQLKANFILYFEGITNKKTNSSGNHGNWKSTLKHLKSYAGDVFLFQDVNESFIEGFRDYLVNTAKTSADKNLSPNAALSYFTKFRTAIGQAYEDNILHSNPAKRVKGIKPADTIRQYLTKEEIIKLDKEDCRYSVLKRAFLFSCLSGMRWVDINNLTWKQVQTFEGGHRISFTQQKTKGVEYLDLPNAALKYLGNKSGNEEQKVFVGLKYSAYMNAALTQWVSKAGINKHITFHCGRHTYATYLLTVGQDIYTVSKLLGHKELKTTLVYAKVVDQMKRDAVSKINNIFK